MFLMTSIRKNLFYTLDLLFVYESNDNYVKNSKFYSTNLYRKQCDDNYLPQKFIANKFLVEQNKNCISGSMERIMSKTETK